MENSQDIVTEAASGVLDFTHDQQVDKLVDILVNDPQGNLQRNAQASLRLRARKHRSSGSSFRKRRTSVGPTMSDGPERRERASSPMLHRSSRLSHDGYLSPRGLDDEFAAAPPSRRRSITRSRRGSNIGESPLYEVSLSKYQLCAFQGTVPTFKFLHDTITLTNRGRSAIQWTVRLPVSPSIQFTMETTSGMIARDHVLPLNIQIVLFSPGHFRHLLIFEFRERGVEEEVYYQFVVYDLHCESKIVVPEISYLSLQGGITLGSGAAGTVTQLQYGDRAVAVKHFRVHDLSEEEADSFRNEILISSNLSHPNIIKCLGVSTHYPDLALVLEYLPLKDLRHLIDSAREDPERLTLPLILRIAIDVAEGMQYLHQRMVMHRDLKPDNILINNLDATSLAEVCAKVTDFGTSRVVSTTSNEGVGTARYMPLEVLSPPKNTSNTHLQAYDHRQADVYSFGMILWEMFSKRIPFENLRWTAEICSHLEEGQGPTFDPAWRAPLGLVELVGQCCSLRAPSRPGFREVLRSLLGVAEGVPALHPFVMSKWKEHDDSRGSGNELSNRVYLLDQNMLKLREERERIHSQIVALQEQLGEIDTQMNDVEAIRKQVISSSAEKLTQLR